MTESSEATYALQQCEIKESKIESLLRRISFQIADDLPKLYCIEKCVPYEIQNKLKKNSTLGQEVLIDKGSFGSVYLTKHLILKIPCALKVHHNITDEELLFQTNEYVIQSQLNQINQKLFVSLIDRIFIKQTEINNYTTYAGLELGNFNLYSYLKQVKVSESEFESIYYSILNGIITMHEHQFAHRDIKPQNILYVEGKGWVLGDFGCSIKYSNIEGKYKICGTKNYLPQNLRKLVKNNFCDQSNVMNLFLNDIYAFQMTMLQLFDPKLQINEIQEILDCQDPYHPLIDSVYPVIQCCKSLDLIKQINRQKYQNIHPQIIESSVFRGLESQKSQLISDVQLIKNYIRELEIQISFQINYSEREVYEENFQKLCKQVSKENQPYIKILHSIVFDTKLDVDICALEVDGSTKHWQYEIIQNGLECFGYYEIRYQNCQKFQKARSKTNLHYKIEEFEMALFLDDKIGAKNALNQIDGQAFYCDDINYLKYYYYKAKLNNEWWEIEDDIILYFKHIHQNDFLLNSVFQEIYYIKNQYEQVQSYTYDDNEYTDYNSLDIHQLRLLMLEKWGNNDSEKLLMLLNSKSKQKQQKSLQNYLQDLINKGHQKYSLIVNLAKKAFDYQIGGELNDAASVYIELINLTKENWKNDDLKSLIFLNFSQLLVEIGDYKAAYEMGKKACEMIKDDIFLSLQCYQLLWYIEVQLQEDDCVNSFASLMNLYKQFKGKKLKFGLIKRVSYGFDIFLARNQYTEFLIHLNLFQDCVKEDEQSNSDYSYLLHNLRWKLYHSQRNYCELRNEFNYFMMNIIQTEKYNLEGMAISLINNLAQIGYFEEKITQTEKNQLFSKHLQSSIIVGDLSELDESDESSSRKFAYNQFNIATENDILLNSIWQRIDIMEHYY